MSDQPEALRLADALRDGKYLLSQERDATEAELRSLHAECEEWRKLRDPVTLHVNLLRGIPARLDDATLWHMAGGDQKVAELHAECERLRADAERYRWLRDGCDHKGSRATFIAANLYGMEWDAAIDAARKP